MQLGRIAGSCSSAEDSQTTVRSLPGMARGFAAGDAASNDDVFAGAGAGGEEGGGLVAEEVELDEFSERSGAEAEAADRADGVPVRGDGWDRGGEPGAVGQARFDARGDPVEAFAFDLFEQPFEEGADLAVVVEGEVGDAFEPLAGVAEDALGAVDHPFLRERVGEHPFGDRAQSDQVVTEFARELFAFIGCEFALLPVEGVGLVAVQDFFDQRLRACSSLFAGEVDFLGGERALNAHAHEFARVGYDLRHGSATSSVCSLGAGGMSMRLRSRGSGATGRNSCSSRRASVRV